MDESQPDDGSDIMFPGEQKGTRRGLSQLREELKARMEAPVDEDEPRISDEELFRNPDELDTIRDLIISLWFSIKRSNKLELGLGILFVILGIFLIYGWWDITADLPEDAADSKKGKEFTGDFKLGEADGVMEGKVSSITYFPKYTSSDFLGLNDSLEEGKLEWLLPNQTTSENLALSDKITLKRVHFENLQISNTLLNHIVLRHAVFTNTTISQSFFLSAELYNVTFVNTRFENVTFVDTEFEKVGLFNVTFSNVLFKRSTLEELLVEDSTFHRSEFLNTPILKSRFRNTTFFEGGFTSTNRKPLTSSMLVFESSDFKNVQIENARFIRVIDPFIFNQTTGYSFVQIEGLLMVTEGNMSERFSDDIYIRFDYEVVEHGGGTRVSEQLDQDYFVDQYIEATPGTIALTLKQTAVFVLMALAGGAILVYAIGGRDVILAMVKFFTPFIIGFGGIAILYLLLSQSDFIKISKWMVLYFLPPLGKESVIPAAILNDNLNWAMVAIVIAFVDVVAALFLAWNFDLAKKIPLIGAFIRRLEAKGTDLMDKRPWVEKFTFLGVVLFVVVPFQGSGAVGGTITGRALGLTPLKVWLAVLCGALLGCFAIAFGVQQGLDFAQEVGIVNFILAIMALIAMLGLVWIFTHWEMVDDEMRPYYEDLKSTLSLEGQSTAFVKSINLDRLRDLAGGQDEDEEPTKDEDTVDQ